MINKYIICIYDLFIKLKNKIEDLLKINDKHCHNDVREQDELELLICKKINHPFKEEERVIFFS